MYIQRTKVYSLSTQMTAGFVFSCVLGFPLHFLYDWTQSRIAAAFAPVNESPFEHLKLVFFPLLLFLALQLIYTHRKRTPIPNLLWVYALATALALSFVTVSYYTYSGILGRHLMPVDIAIFVLALALAYYAAYRLIRSHPARIKGFDLIGGAVLFMLALLLIVFTYLPPHLPWFCDPLTGSYGLA